MKLIGERVVLRSPSQADLDSLVALFAEPQVAEWWPRYDRRRIDDELLHADSDTTVYAVEVDGQLAGIIQSWEEEDDDYRHAGIDIAISSTWHGRGIAVDALRTVARHLITADGHHRLVIDPALANTRAIRCYEKVGFRPVGVMRQYERGADGTFHDSLLMDLLAGELNEQQGSARSSGRA